MSRYEPLLQRILGGRSDASFRFDDLRGLLRNLGFTERVRGSHHIFRREGVAERINLQRDDSHANQRLDSPGFTLCLGRASLILDGHMQDRSQLN